MAEKETLFTAFSKAQQSFKPAIKDTNNPYFKSKYADLASIWEACREALAENDLFVTQSTGISEAGRDVLITRVYHISGEYLESTTHINCAKQNDPQAFGSAMTYTRRYSLAAILGIITDDDDAEGAMARPTEKAQPVQQKQAAPVKKSETPKVEEFTPDPNVKYATAKQKEEIIALLNNVVITRQEKTAMLLKINQITEEQAPKSIAKLKATIEERESQAKAA